MNVTEIDLRTYIERFHSTLEATAKAHLAQEHQDRLLHLSLSPARVTGYISTQFGVAIEYEPSELQQIEIHRGSARVENLLFRPPASLDRVPPFVNIAGTGSRIAHCNFSGRIPLNLTRQEADVSMEDVVVDFGQRKRVIHYAEIFGNRARERWLPETADVRATNEVLAALVLAQQAQKAQVSLAEYIERFKQKTVLVLGDYEEPGLTRLKAILNGLRQLGYDPILVKDIPDHPHQDLRQKVVAIGAISRFVVVDDSSKSGHLVEIPLCEQNKWITILLRAEGKGGSWMTAGASHLSNVILEHPYDPLSPGTALNDATKWAEGKLVELQRKFETTYPWRKQNNPGTS